MMKKKSETIEYIAAVRINTDPPLLPGDSVKFGKGKGQLDPEHKDAYLKAGQVKEK